MSIYLNKENRTDLGLFVTHGLTSDSPYPIVPVGARNASAMAVSVSS